MKIKEDLGAPINRGWDELISASPLSSDDDEDKDENEDVDDNHNHVDILFVKRCGIRRI